MHADAYLEAVHQQPVVDQCYFILGIYTPCKSLYLYKSDLYVCIFY